MVNSKLGTFTVIYSCENTLELMSEVCQFPISSHSARVIIPNSFKSGKIIIAVCDGKVNVLNKLGDRAFSTK
ncbi:MAG: TIGR02922 family protein [Gammaproteobacteria bacterium]|nr:TIGR02922 family protein [Gammaproteobacteria bacterium]